MDYIERQRLENELKQRLNDHWYGPLTRGDIILINRFYRKIDESHLYPVRNRFNVTERAIRKVRVYAGQTEIDTPQAYFDWMESVISEIVNDPRNG